MAKFEVISQKPSKNWIFGKNGHFLTVFGQKWQIFDFFLNSLRTFFTLPKPYLTAKFQKKVMNGCLDICVTDIRTYVRTYKGQLIGLPAARPKIKKINNNNNKCDDDDNDYNDDDDDQKN